MFHPDAPLHEIRRLQFAIGHCCYRDGRKTSCGTCLWRCTRKLTLREPHTETLMCSHGCVHRAVRYAWRIGHAADGAEQASLKRLNVGWIGSDQVGNAARQNIAENPEASSKYRFRLDLPRDRRSRLKDCDW